jgi:recyclin-1
LTQKKKILTFLGRNYLAAFKKVLALPVDLVSTAATTIASPFQRSNTLTNKHEKKDSTVSVESISTPPSTPKVSSSTKRDSSSSTTSIDANGQLEVAKQELDMLQNYLSLEISLQLIHINKESERRVQQFVDIGFPGRMKLDMYVTICLFFFIKKIVLIIFVSSIFSQRTYENIFIQLLKTLGQTHIQPGFDR